MTDAPNAEPKTEREMFESMFPAAKMWPHRHADIWEGWQARALAAPPCAVPAERLSADWRRLTGLWRYGVAVCPPTCKDFYNWLGVLDAAIDERTSRG